MMLKFKSIWHMSEPEALADEISEAVDKFLSDNKERSKYHEKQITKLIDNIKRKYYAKTAKKQRTKND